MSEKTHELKELIEIWLAVKNNKTGEIWNNQVAEYVDDRIVELLSAPVDKPAPSSQAAVAHTPVTKLQETLPLPIQELRALKYVKGQDNSEYISVSKLTQATIDFLKAKNGKFEDIDYIYTKSDKWLNRRPKPK